jgi:hypothetical protein
MFKDPSIHRELSENGFAVIDANLLAETQQLRTYIEARFKLPAGEFYYSLLANSPAENKELHNAIDQILRGFYETHFTNYRILTQSFLSKPANTTDELLLHQDWCYTDERQHAAYNIWLPLIDVTEKNGTMFFLRGSHLWFNNLRSATLPTARISINNFQQEQITTVTLKQGQVLLFHPAVFHGSYPNLSSANRIVTTATILPKDAPFVYFQNGNADDEALIFQLQDDYFLKDLGTIAVGGRPVSYEIGRVKYRHVIVSERELKAKLQLA